MKSWGVAKLLNLIIYTCLKYGIVKVSLDRAPYVSPYLAAHVQLHTSGCMWLLVSGYNRDWNASYYTCINCNVLNYSDIISCLYVYFLCFVNCGQSLSVSICVSLMPVYTIILFNKELFED